MIKSKGNLRHHDCVAKVRIKGEFVRVGQFAKKILSSHSVVKAANIGLLAFILAPLTATERLPAGFSSKVARVNVEIDGISYGAFDPVLDFEKNATHTGGDKSSYQKVTLKRHFVTDQSLYKWADESMRGQSRLRDVVLVSENAEGVEIARHLLRKAQPVSAVVEASNPEVGGLHEKIEFTVRSIEAL
jgi:hypothetical protein